MISWLRYIRIPDMPKALSEAPWSPCGHIGHHSEWSCLVEWLCCCGREPLTPPNTIQQEPETA